MTQNLNPQQTTQLNTPQGLELTAEQLHRLGLNRAVQVLANGWEPLAETELDTDAVRLWTDALRPLVATPDQLVCVRTAR